MNRQHVFDTAVAALIAQGKPAYSTTDRCLYRAPDGCKCAIGHLIPDDRYDTSLEGIGADTVSVRDALPFDTTRDDADFLDDLQGCHDWPAMEGLTGAEWLAEFKGRARRLATDHGLDTKVLDA